MAEPSSPEFVLKVDGVEGVCPAGEAWAERNLAEGKIPVFSCEGPCIRGEIARRAANLVADEAPYARGCYAETFFVPHSAMRRWAQEADKAVMIDGCFLKCVGRVLNNLVDEKKIIHIDALRLYKKYSDVFTMDDVPEAEKQVVAREVADKILAVLRENPATASTDASIDQDQDTS